MKFQTFIRTCNLIKARLNKIMSYVTSLPTDTPLEPVDQQRLLVYEAEVSLKRAEFEKNLKKLLDMSTLPTDYDENNAIERQDEIDDLCVSIQSTIKTYLLKFKSDDDSQSESSHVNDHENTGLSAVRLPRIDLKHFNGDPQTWVAYINLYDATIHANSTLPPAVKFQYLLGTLSGEALNLIKSLPISDPNYNIAYNMLRERYHSVRRLSALHMNKIIDLPAVSFSNAKNLRNFLNTFNENSQALKALGCNIVEDNPLLTSMLLRKLDSHILNKFESSRSDSQALPTVKEVIKFLSDQCVHAEDVSMHSSDNTSKWSKFNSHISSSTPRSNPGKPHPRVTTLVSTQNDADTSTGNSCFACSKPGHKIYICTLFKEKTPQERYQIVKSQHRCFSCLGNHETSNCKSKNSCFKCHKKHHTLLHLDRLIKNNADLSSNDVKTTAHNSQSNNEQSQFAAVSTNVAQTQTNTTVLLATVLVKLVTKKGNSHVFRALVDSCSQCDFISERAAQLLGVQRHKSTICVNGISQSLATSNGIAYLHIDTLNNNRVSENHPMLILDRITSDLPKTPLSSDLVDLVKSYPLSDPHYHRPGPVDVLLGGALFPIIFTGEKKPLGPNLPFIMNTVFGHTLMGRAPCHGDPNSDRNSTHLTTLLTISDFDLHSSIQRFWEHEEPPKSTQVTPDEELCENHFVNTHSRDSTGRYCVRLPFKPNHPPLGESTETAKQRLFSLENRFKTQPHFKEAYVKVIDDYLNSGHMRCCETIPDNNYCLPHHGVLKDSSSTTKLRTVFDASSKTSTNVSLNDILLTGSKLQVNIFDVLFHFRRHNVVFTCDIRQMYRQIRIHPEDQRFQIIFWRNDSSLPLETYFLETVTFGMNSSPFLALRTLRQLAQDERELYPEAADVLLNHTYIDDVIAGHEDEEKAQRLQFQLIALLKKGCFDLRKWASNSATLLGSFPSSHHEVPKFVDSTDQPFFSILGLYWSPTHDCFSFNFHLESFSRCKPTKRNVLSMIAKISYDPCGFLSPVTMWVKIFMQLLWSKGFSWDEILPPDLVETWNTFVAQLSSLSEIEIPRSLQISRLKVIQLHGFSDASESGYSAVVYLRCSEDNESVIVRQLISKTRVAPLKRITLPRLELCGSHLLAKLISYCLSLLKPHYTVDQTFAWTDSTIVLSWIQTPPYRLKTYIANRISHIQQLVPSHIWAHVNSSSNPADCASRGIMPLELKEHPLWWHGPPWLSKSTSLWPVSSFTPINEEDLEETKPQGHTVLLTSENEPLTLLTKFSSWNKLLRVFSYVLRFIRLITHQETKRGPLTVEELKTSTLKIYQLVQRQVFSPEIHSLQQKKCCSTRIQRLAPFIDKDGLIRVGGRLKNASLDYDVKHPVLLPKNHHVVTLLVDHYHLKYLHAPPQLLQSLLAQNVWILSARSLIRSRVFHCIKCFRSKPRNKFPLMGDLPEPRVTPSRPFLDTGVDFCGPFVAKAHNLKSMRHFKLYICIFVCFSTKAVHLETTTELSSPAFISALTRFVSRRGICKNLYCDNGTNFVGANNILKSAVTSFLKNGKTQEDLIEFSTQHSITFHFNPAYAPHQGGLWEAAVKSMKYHLRRVVGESVLTIEDYNTISAKIEAILNSRPLIPLSSDPMDLTALTPGHFLIGAPLTAVPEDNLSSIPINRLKRWQQLQSFTQCIWKRWSLDYLHTLQERGKWSRNTQNLKIGDLVIIQDLLTPPLCWPLARIVSTHPGHDNVVRVVTLQTKNGTLTRPAVKVFPLPVN